VTAEVRGLGQIAPGISGLIVAVLAQVADMERQRISGRTATSRELVKATMATTGKTHKGKKSQGRPVKADTGAVKLWKQENKASISATAA
jgi:putative DNA-invertase from lambdoid prophage Rac